MSKDAGGKCDTTRSHDSRTESVSKRIWVFCHVLLGPLRVLRLLRLFSACFELVSLDTVLRAPRFTRR